MRRRGYRPHKHHTPQERYPYIARGIVYGLLVSCVFDAVVGLMVWWVWGLMR